MGGGKKIGKERQDKYYHLAKEAGFRARSAFKLLQLERKFNFLANAKVCIDLCAAPGGWMQVAAQTMPQGSLIIGVDLVPIKPIRGCIGICADITTDKCRQALKIELKHMKANVVLNDGAPNVGSAWTQDAYSQSGLVLMSLKLATEWLIAGGVFISKIFRSRDYNKLMYIFNQLFTKVNATKPQSSRNVSAEIFVVCSGYKAPSKIDPRMLDPKHVFAEVDDDTAKQTRKTDITKPEKHKRQREGYEDNNPGQHKKYSADMFVNGSNFMDVLGDYNELVFDKGSKYLGRPETDEDILHMMKDLKLLGKKDFRALIKWRSVMVKWASAQVKADLAGDEGEADADSGEEDAGESSEEEDEQTKLENMIEEQKVKEAREKKRERRKRDKARAKLAERQALNMDLPVDIQDVVEDSQLFAMKMIKTKTGLNSIESGELLEEDAQGVYLTPSQRAREGQQVFGTKTNINNDGSAEAEADDDSEEEGDNYEAQLEAQYDDYLDRKGMLQRKVKMRNKTQTLGEKGADGVDAPDDDYVPEDASDAESDASDAPVSKKDANPLIPKSRTTVDMTRNTTDMWFSQGVFAGIEDDDESSEEDSDAEQEDSAVADHAAQAPTAKDEEDDGFVETFGLNDSDLSDSEDEDDMDAGTAAARAPAPKDMSKSLDSHGLALAAEMIIRKRKREIIDHAYNRYTFNDDPLPHWFEDEEEQHKIGTLPITKEMVEDVKARERAINARPIKKVLEAKGRAQRKVDRERQKLVQNATRVNDNEVLSTAEKAHQIRAMFKRAARNAKGAHVRPDIVVARKGSNTRNLASGGGSGARYKVVDKRFKSDMKGSRRLAAKKKSGRNGGAHTKDRVKRVVKNFN